MLKIKDDVDLKELEKFGFDIQSNTKDNFDQIYQFDSGLMFDKDYKDISIPYFDYEDKPLDTLYDLIQAGLVEKVKEQL